jgi:hypothetical protein
MPIVQNVNIILKTATALVIALFMSQAIMAQGNNCSQAEIERAAAAAKSASQTLLKIPDSDMETNVSNAMRKSIVLTKKRLDDLVTSYMKCVPPQSPDAGKIEKDLSDIARKFQETADTGDENASDEEKTEFESWFNVQITKDARRLVSIEAIIPIPCGSDSMLLVFAPSGETWKKVLRWQSQPYDTIGKAFWFFDYAISPPDASGRWFVAAKSVAPWCSSTWSEIRSELLTYP